MKQHTFIIVTDRTIQIHNTEIGLHDFTELNYQLSILVKTFNLSKHILFFFDHLQLFNGWFFRDIELLSGKSDIHFVFFRIVVLVE